jgi:hypothetical protein
VGYHSPRRRRRHSGRQEGSVLFEDDSTLDAHGETGRMEERRNEKRERTS